MQDSKEFTCPMPMRWNEIYKTLCKQYETKTKIKLPTTCMEIFNAGGPPTPLILAGWDYSSDFSKNCRWNETIIWAEKHGLSDFIDVQESDRYY